jgi:hypothetical protein
MVPRAGGPSATGVRLAHQQELIDLLDRVAQDYDEIADDLERDAMKIRHPELMPQSKRS